MKEQHADEVLVYDVGDDESTSEAVVEAVADVAGVRVVASDGGEGAVLDRLYETVDPDALDALFCRDAGAPDQFDGEVTFSYHGHRVRIRNDERVVVEQPKPALDEPSV